MKEPLKLNIPQPCHEQWSGMTPQDQGRFCGSCQKVVVDFSAMTDRQILEYFSNFSGSTCGRFTNDQLNRDIAVGPQKPKHWFKYMLNALIPALLVSGKSFSQGAPVVKKDSLVCTDSKLQTALLGRVLPTQKTITGRIMDNYGSPVPFASVVLKGSSHGIAADAEGNFKLKVSEEQPVALIVSAVGMRVTQVVVDPEKTNISVVLEKMEDELISGAIVIVKKPKKKKPVFHNFKNFIRDSLKKQTFTIYPNPANAGALVKTTYKLKKGNYHLQVYNVNGQVMQEEMITVTIESSEASFRLSTNIQAGQYTVLVTDDKRKKIGSQSLIVQ